MDATRSRRTKDAARQRWYASSRCRRLARLLGFLQFGHGSETVEEDKGATAGGRASVYGSRLN